jgi:hypothetical protein
VLRPITLETALNTIETLRAVVEQLGNGRGTTLDSIDFANICAQLTDQCVELRHELTDNFTDGVATDAVFNGLDRREAQRAQRLLQYSAPHDITGKPIIDAESARIIDGLNNPSPVQFDDGESVHGTAWYLENGNL